MNFLNKILPHKYWWITILLLLFAITFLSSFLQYRIDLTTDKRFSLTSSTKKILKHLDSTITIKVFLTGDLPADYKKLSIATNDLLTEFKDVSSNKINFSFEEPGKDLPDSERFKLYDSLDRMGVVFEPKDTKASQTNSAPQFIIPSALVYYKNKKPFAVDLRSSKTIYKNYNVITDEPEDRIDKEATRNAAEALLEYKFANAIDKLTRTYVPAVAYIIGNGEAGPAKVNDLIQSLKTDYRFGVFDLKQSYPNAGQINALLIVKPTQAFTEEDKLKLDQYVMHGGKIIWFINKLYAEIDSLMRSQSDFVAFDRNLNLDDILFKYGVRINSDLLQDLNCSKIPVVIGYNADGSPRMQRMPWPYYPFLSADNNNPISKNLDRVISIFPSSIDTIRSLNIYKTILLASDTNSRLISSPALVSLNSVKDDPNLLTFSKSHIPVAILLEGEFTSLFANRLTQHVRDSVYKSLGKPFLAKSIPTKQIVVSDGDMVTNVINSTSGPLPMGMLEFENYRFANREFLLNSLDYLVSTTGLFESRNKIFVLRLLDKQKVQEERTTWQFINIGLPILLIILLGIVFNLVRKKLYTK